MKLTTFSLLFICMAYVHGCIDNAFADEGCADYDYIAKINCADDECTCNSPVGICDSITGMAELTPGTLNGAKCEEICTDSDDCIFFRWDKVGSVHSYCTLMSVDQCKGFLECDRGQCVSGQAGCHNSVSPLPDTAVCAGKVPFLQGNIHWFCTFEDEPINIYDIDTVPTGTKCKTAHKCASFDIDSIDEAGNNLANDLVVECNPEGATVASFLWGFTDQCLYTTNTSMAMSEDKLTLIDPECTAKPEPLEILDEKLTEPGVSLVCDMSYTSGPDASGATIATVTAPNACVLLCNFHHAFSFESELAHDGTGVWNKYEVGSDVGHELAAIDVKCWDSMKI